MERPTTRQEYIESRVAPEFWDKASVIGLVHTEEWGDNWWVIHDGEEMPIHVYVKISEEWE